MLSSGKPDLRTAHPHYGQLDVELKYKITGTLGKATGLSILQELKIKEMNEAGMPAVGFVWSVPHHKYFLTNFEKQDIGELEDWRWIVPVVKRVASPVTVYIMARRYLRELGYPSADFLRNC